MPYISLTKKECEKESDSPEKEKERRLENTKKIFRHPIRDRILSILRDGEPRTQREIGKILSMSNAAIHYHIKMLLDVSFIKLHDTRPGPNGITEKLFTLDIENWPPVSEDDIDFYLDYTLSWVNERNREGLSILKSKDYNLPFLAGSYSVNAPDDKVRQLKRKVEKLFNDFFDQYEKSEGDNLVSVAVTFSVLPSRYENAEDSRNILEFEPE